MCGIAGVISFTEEGKKYLDKIGDAVDCLRHRGPNASGIFKFHNVAFGHTRLSIIDTSAGANQPFISDDDSHCIIFNGEIFNYQELRKELESIGMKFRTHSDTEVLLQLYMREGISCLTKLNGFFAFAVYNKEDRSVFIARDRYGEKPLYWSINTHALFFGSEPKALYANGAQGELNHDALCEYLHLNYNFGEETIVDTVFRLEPGTCFHIAGNGDFLNDGEQTWYDRDTLILPSKKIPDYTKAKKEVRRLLEKAVERRMIADVPLGTFLSGGVDSSIVSALAKKLDPALKTFSIGYQDEPHFDETYFANKVAEHIGTDHTIISVDNEALLASMRSFVEAIDEPFADSSALAMNILARETRKQVTVALSGDGADELFAGYNKHAAEFIARDPGIRESFVRACGPLWKMLPASRQSKFGNTIRQLRKFSNGIALSKQKRYWLWAGYANEELLDDLLNVRTGNPVAAKTMDWFSNEATDFNEVLLADFKMVLDGDMLVKVDRMSMLNGLEVRSPFLDHELVEYVMRLPAEYKIDRHHRKKILKESCVDLLPQEIFQREKQGFEVPLLKWFKGEMKPMLDEVMNKGFILDQGIFHMDAIDEMRIELHSSSPGESVSRVWGLFVFQKWWLKYGRRSI